jgi:hypothetical protein
VFWNLNDYLVYLIFVLLFWLLTFRIYIFSVKK